jgi:hypothetical protein
MILRRGRYGLALQPLTKPVCGTYQRMAWPGLLMFPYPSPLLQALIQHGVERWNAFDSRIMLLSEIAVSGDNYCIVATQSGRYLAARIEILYIPL